MSFGREKFEEFEKPPILPEEEKAEEIEEKGEVKLEEIKKFEAEIIEIEKVKMGIDREWSKDKEKELQELKEKNKERFERLNFDLENLEIYAGDLSATEAKGHCKSFFEIVIVDKNVLSESEIVKDCVISHEIGHYLFNQKLPQEFFNRHPELREKKRELFKAWIDKKERLPPLMKDEFIEEIKNKYQVGKKEEELTIEKAIGILEKFVKDFQDFKPKSTDPKIFKAITEYGMTEDFLVNFNRESPFKSEREYENQAIIILGQLGELLTRKLNETEAEKYDISYLERAFIEEGASTYLAAKIMDIPLSEFPYREESKVTVAKDWERKLKKKIEPLVEAVKKKEFFLVELYKT